MVLSVDSSSEVPEMVSNSLTIMPIILQSWKQPCWLRVVGGQTLELLPSFSPIYIPEPEILPRNLPLHWKWLISLSSLISIQPENCPSLALHLK